MGSRHSLIDAYTSAPLNQEDASLFLHLTAIFSDTISVKMLKALPLRRAVPLILLLCLACANCPTPPFCDGYPKCSRDCLGDQNLSGSFSHSYGTGPGVNMTQVCSTGDAGGPLADHYNVVFLVSTVTAPLPMLRQPGIN